MSDDTKTLADQQAALLAFINQEEGETAEATTVVHKTPHPVSKIRHWRQRYAGLEGNYIFRKGLNIRGADGKMRRVRAGDPVDVDGDGISPRRLKSLWYSEMIEVADFGTSNQVRKVRRVTIRDNRAIRERHAEEARQDMLEERSHRSAVKRARQREREEDNQRQLADEAVREAERREVRELAVMEAEIAAEERAERVKHDLAELQAREREEAAAAIEAAAEEAADREEREYEEALKATERDLQAQAEYAEHLEGKAERAAERAVELAATRRSDAERAELAKGPDAPKNPKNRSVDAKVIRKEVLGREL